MKTSNLVKVLYQDADRGIFLECYADAIVYQNGKGGAALYAIRLGGYPEQVRGIVDAIYGGGSIRLEQEGGCSLSLKALAKQYDRKLSMDGVYAEATIFVRDEPEIAVSGSEDGQTRMPAPRRCYIFTPPGDRDRLFEEIDLRTGAPLIREFQDYFLDTLTARGFLTPLKVFSPHERFDAWQLSCSADDQNLIQVLEDGLKSGAIAIPGATGESAAAFEDIRTVSQYLHKFGVTIADRIKGQFRPLFDPAAEPVSREVLLVNETVRQNCGYRLYDAQLAAAEALKRKIDRHEPAILVAECGSGKSATRS